MDNDDDVEHLFSWLQTPELRYREFAGAREITDTVVTWQARQNTDAAVALAREMPAEHDAQLEEEYPADQFPDQSAASVEFAPATGRGPAMIAPVPMSPAEWEEAPTHAGPFALGAAGRNAPRQPQDAERGVPPPIIQTPAPRLGGAPEPPSAPPVSAPRPATNGVHAGGLLGGAYRENGSNGNGAAPPMSPVSRNERSLDAVFGRLAGTRAPILDPRERSRHGPGLAPPDGRPR